MIIAIDFTSIDGGRQNTQFAISIVEITESLEYLVRTWVPVVDDEVQREEYREGDQRHIPADQEHDGHAHQEARQGQPHVVKLKRTWNFKVKG